MKNKPSDKITVNSHFEITASDLENASIISRDENSFKVLYKEKVYDLKLLDKSIDQKMYRVKINGYTLEAKVMDAVDQVVNQLGFNSASRHTVKEVVAPMPGLVLDIMVGEGDSVEKGDNLLILEAMKMENIIKSAGEGVIAKINVKKGDKVEKGQVLAHF